MASKFFPPNHCLITNKLVSVTQLEAHFPTIKTAKFKILHSHFTFVLGVFNTFKHTLLLHPRSRSRLFHILIPPALTSCATLGNSVTSLNSAAVLVPALQRVQQSGERADV